MNFWPTHKHVPHLKMILNQIKPLHLLPRLENVSPQTLRLFCAGIAVLIAMRVIQAQNGWITDDSVLYLEVARLFSIGQWEAGFKLYNWPLYPALIQGVHEITGLGLQASAQSLVLLFFGLTSYYFSTLIILCGGGRLAVAYGTLILVSSTYIVGDILPMLIRDQGFWAFFLAALTYFIRFYQTGKLMASILWQLSIAIAALFRIEGITFLALLPFSLLMDRTIGIKTRLARLLSAHFLTISILMLSLIAMVTQMINLDSIGRLEVLIAPQTYAAFFETFSNSAGAMATHVLGPFLEDYAAASLLLSLFFIVIAKIFGASGLVTIALVFQGFRERFLGISPAGKSILGWAAAIALLNMLFILTKEFILSGRYVIPLSFILMTIAAIVMANLFPLKREHLSKDRIKTRILIGLILFLTLNLIHNLLPVRPGHNYEQEAVAWIKKQTPDNSKVFYVSPRARYFAGKEFSGRGYDYWEQVTGAIQDGTIYKYDYLVINISRKHPEHEHELLLRLPEYKLVKVFQGVKGRKKMIILTRINK